MTTLPESDFVLITEDDLEPDPPAADLAQRQPEINEPPERIHPEVSTVQRPRTASMWDMMGWDNVSEPLANLPVTLETPPELTTPWADEAFGPAEKQASKKSEKQSMPGLPLILVLVGFTIMRLAVESMVSAAPNRPSPRAYCTD